MSETLGADEVCPLSEGMVGITQPIAK